MSPMCKLATLNQSCCNQLYRHRQYHNHSHSISGTVLYLWEIKLRFQDLIFLAHKYSKMMPSPHGMAFDLHSSQTGEHLIGLFFCYISQLNVSAKGWMNLWICCGLAPQMLCLFFGGKLVMVPCVDEMRGVPEVQGHQWLQQVREVQNHPWHHCHQTLPWLQADHQHPVWEDSGKSLQLVSSNIQ